mmetsp:Transcript_41304/g.99100  ORF Transcript_41304/g.99100 Transcript_41304/m.99100 type:complete len:224 (-) Transcript_41304:786-1457(-)
MVDLGLTPSAAGPPPTASGRGSAATPAQAQRPRRYLGPQHPPVAQRRFGLRSSEETSLSCSLPQLPVPAATGWWQQPARSLCLFVLRLRLAQHRRPTRGQQLSGLARACWAHSAYRLCRQKHALRPSAAGQQTHVRALAQRLQCLAGGAADLPRAGHSSPQRQGGHLVQVGAPEPGQPASSRSCCSIAGPYSSWTGPPRSFVGRAHPAAPAACESTRPSPQPA